MLWMNIYWDPKIISEFITKKILFTLSNKLAHLIKTTYILK